MLQKLKQWWVAIVGIALVILDLGFDVVNPILLDSGISIKWLSIIKVIFGVYGIYRLYNTQPKNSLFITNTQEEPIIGDRPNDR